MDTLLSLLQFDYAKYRINYAEGTGLEMSGSDHVFAKSVNPGSESTENRALTPTKASARNLVIIGYGFQFFDFTDVAVGKGSIEQA